MTYKLYEVILQDEWNNLAQLGWFEKLDDAIPHINAVLTVSYGNKYALKKGDIVEYPSTYEMCFDTELNSILNPNDEDDYIPILVRGFIYEFENEEDYLNMKKLLVEEEKNDEQENICNTFIN